METPTGLPAHPRPIWEAFPQQDTGCLSRTLRPLTGLPAHPRRIWEAFPARRLALLTRESACLKEEEIQTTDGSRHWHRYARMERHRTVSNIF